MTLKTQKNFYSRCRRIALVMELGHVFFFPGEKKPVRRYYVGNGSLHVTRSEVRASFDISNGLKDTPAEQSRKARMVLQLLRIKGTNL